MTASASEDGAAALPPPMVYIVDDDNGFRDSLRFLLESVHLPCRAWTSGQEFLNSDPQLGPGCMVLDVRLPGLSGLELQRQLRHRGYVPPLIFVTAFGEVPVAVQALKDGAYDYLEKPVSSQLLVDRIQAAVHRSLAEFRRREREFVARSRLATLTERELQVLDGILACRSSREIAGDLNLSDKTVESHRSSLMRKLRTHSLVELVMTVWLARGGPLA